MAGSPSFSVVSEAELRRLGQRPFLKPYIDFLSTLRPGQTARVDLRGEKVRKAKYRLTLAAKVLNMEINHNLPAPAGCLFFRVISKDGQTAPPPASIFADLVPGTETGERAPVSV